MSKIRSPRPTGVVSARTVGAVRILQQRAARALEAARGAEPDSQHAAALRGKARGYAEAAGLLLRLERGLPLNGRHDHRPARRPAEEKRNG